MTSTVNTGKVGNPFFNPLGWFFPKKTPANSIEANGVQDNGHHENNEDALQKSAVKESQKENSEVLDLKKDTPVKTDMGNAPSVQDKTSSDSLKLEQADSQKGNPVVEMAHDGDIPVIPKTDVVQESNTPVQQEGNLVQSADTPVKPDVQVDNSDTAQHVNDTDSGNLPVGNPDKPKQLWDLDHIDIGFFCINVKPLKDGVKSTVHAMPLENFWKMASALMNFHLNNGEHGASATELPRDFSQPVTGSESIGASPRPDQLHKNNQASSQTANSFI